eukprot:COSAG01_NODE_20600_length_945_cov_3.607565_2_plen_127_part_01
MFVQPTINLDSAWVQHINDAGKAYYNNESTMETKWERPPEGVREVRGQCSSNSSGGSDEDHYEGGDGVEFVEDLSRASVNAQDSDNVARDGISTVNLFERMGPSQMATVAQSDQPKSPSSISSCCCV